MAGETNYDGGGGEDDDDGECGRELATKDRPRWSRRENAGERNARKLERERERARSAGGGQAAGEFKRGHHHRPAQGQRERAANAHAVNASLAASLLHPVPVWPSRHHTLSESSKREGETCALCGGDDGGPVGGGQSRRVHVQSGGGWEWGRHLETRVRDTQEGGREEEEWSCAS